MVLKLYGYHLSTCTRLVAAVCVEKEIPYEFHPIDLAKREQKAAGYLQYQPFGKVPYIDDDGFILYESRAIARYLINKYPNQGTTGLIPTEPKEAALFEQAASIEHFNFEPYASGVAYERVFKLRAGGQTDETRVAEYLQKLNASLDVYERILSKQKYLAGDNVTLADFQHYGFGSLLFAAKAGNVITDRPNVARWWNDITSRHGWTTVKNGVP